MRSVTAGKFRPNSSSTTYSSPTTRSCGSGNGGGTAKRKRPDWGEPGPFYSHASIWGTLGGSRVFPEMVRASLNFKSPKPKSPADPPRLGRRLKKIFESKARQALAHGFFLSGGEPSARAFLLEPCGRDPCSHGAARCGRHVKRDTTNAALAVRSRR